MRYYEQNYEQLGRYMLNCVFGGYDFDFATLCLGRGFHCFDDSYFHVLSVVCCSKHIKPELNFIQ